MLIVSACLANVRCRYDGTAKPCAAVIRLVGAQAAILKARSPSCGAGKIYDGSFSGTLIQGQGVFAALCQKSGLQVTTEEEVSGVSSSL